jgi:hypothetical protein
MGSQNTNKKLAGPLGNHPGSVTVETWYCDRLPEIHDPAQPATPLSA